MLDLRTLAQDALDQHPDSTALIIGDHSISYRAFDELIQMHADALAAQGISKGDRVGLLSHNHPDLAALLFAAWRIGAIVVPLNYRYQGPEVEFAVAHGGVRILIIQDQLARGLVDAP